MADGEQPPSGMAFPPKMNPENDEYVVEDMHNVPDGYGLDDRGRCKRRKRCGQCGPCQVKENCMKCHFCVRKDVLKQTCIYRKCIYLRSKPKPYSRPHQSPQSSGRLSPGREASRQSPAVKSPVGIVSPGLPFGEQSMAEPRSENPFFPPQLPQLPQSQLGALQNNGYTSPVHMMDRGQALPGSSAVNMNMQLNMTPQLPNSAASSPIHKITDATSPLGLPQPVNSPPSSVPGMPQISGNAPPVPSIPPVVPSLQSVLPAPITTNTITGIPSIPSIPAMPGMNERAINDLRSPDQLGLHSHHPHPHFPGVPPVHPHPHLPHRDSNLFGDHSRVPHMNFGSGNHMESFSRGPNDSSCMYHPSLPYSMPGHFQPTGPSFLSGAAEMNPFRSNFLNSFPPGYSYPPDRYREGFSSLPFTRLGMSSSGTFPQYPGQGAGYGVGNSLSQQYSPYNSQHGCPKNGSCPPVSPSTEKAKVLQEGYTKSNDKFVKVLDGELSLTECKSDISDDSNLKWEEMSPGPASTSLANEKSPKQLERSSSVSSVSSRSSVWEPWRSPFWLVESRQDDVRSVAGSSHVSSDFECEVISVDDLLISARIRSDGCNSIEIDIDGSSVSSDFQSPRGERSKVSKQLFQDDKVKDFDTNSKKLDKTRASQHGKKYLSEALSVIQDLGDEGTLRLELPGNKVTVEDIDLNHNLFSKSANNEELRNYLDQYKSQTDQVGC